MTEGPYKLPEGWRWVRLGEVCEVLMGQSPPSSTYNHDELGLPFFQGKADFGELHPTPRAWCTKPMKIAEAGDILISVRAPVGPTNLAKERCCIGRGLAALRAGHDIQTGWLLFYLCSIEQELGQSGSGSTFNAITKKELSAILVPLPPLAEQRRIVAELDAAREKLQALKQAQAKTGEELQRLEHSILDKAFRGEL
jgi:type I restriction enzyme S subunit